MYMQYATYDRSNGNLIQRITLDAFWTAIGVTPNSYSFDPRILYEATLDRWYAVSVDNARASNQFLLAVSKTNNPAPTSGNWYVYSIPADQSNVYWADYPMIGYNADYLVLTANMFGVNANLFTTTYIVLNKANLLAGTKTVVFSSTDAYASTGSTPQPVLDRSGYSSDVFFVSDDTQSITRLNSNTGVVTTLQSGLSSSCYRPAEIPQPSSTATIASGDTRVSGEAILVNGKIQYIHSCSSTGGTVSEFIRYNVGTNAVEAKKYISVSGVSMSYPSIDVTSDGFTCIGFSYGSSSVVMSSGVACMDSAMTLIAGKKVRTGSGVYEPSGSQRWGDYSATVVDPANSLRVCAYTEYVLGASNWAVGTDCVCAASVFTADSTSLTMAMSNVQPSNPQTNGSSSTPAPLPRPTVPIVA